VTEECKGSEDLEIPLGLSDCSSYNSNYKTLIRSLKIMDMANTDILRLYLKNEEQKNKETELPLNSIEGAHFPSSTLPRYCGLRPREVVDIVFLRKFRGWSSRSIAAFRRRDIKIVEAIVKQFEKDLKGKDGSS
jgi:hypothetical protein